MPMGPGKYDETCTMARLDTEAVAVALIVINGRLGSGFSVQGNVGMPPEVLVKLLRQVADEIENSI
jgi:hypothetical protein